MGNKGRLIAVGVGVAVAAAIAAAVVFGMQGPGTGLSSNPRSVFWPHVHGLGIDPSDSSILYIATHGDFYRSVAGGPPVKVDIQRADYMAFTAPLNEGAPLYASGHPSTGGNTGLIKSTDGGQTWQVVSTVLDPPVDFHSMALSRSDPNIIIGFDSAGRGLFKTTDAGQTWEKLDYPEYITALALSPNTPEITFAGTGAGLFQSSDGGASWSHLNQYKGLMVHALAFSADGALYASTDTFGLSRSPDLAATWERVGQPDITVTSIAVDSHGGALYVGGYSPEGYQEVYRGSLDGSDWQLIGTNREL